MTEGSQLGGLILAAGASGRLGRPKQQLQLGGRSLLVRAVEMLQTLGIDTPRVILGALADEHRGLLAQHRVVCHFNAAWQAGLGNSLAFGIGCMQPSPPSAVLLLTVDQYRLQTEDLERLVGVWRRSPDRIVAAGYAGTVGPPVVFPRRLFPLLAQQSGERGAKSVIVHEGFEELALPAAAYDLDTPADFEVFAEYAAQQTETGH